MSLFDESIRGKSKNSAKVRNSPHLQQNNQQQGVPFSSSHYVRLDLQEGSSLTQTYFRSSLLSTGKQRREAMTGNMSVSAGEEGTSHNENGWKRDPQ